MLGDGLDGLDTLQTVMATKNAEYDEKQKCPPGPPFLGMVGKGFFSSEAFPKISDLLALSCIR